MKNTKIKVYYFTRYDIATDRNDRMPRAGTLEAIAHAQGAPSVDTEHLVDISELDGDGFVKKQK